MTNVTQMCNNVHVGTSNLKTPLQSRVRLDTQMVVLNVYYVTVQNTFHIPEFARKGRNLYCEVAHINTVWVSRLVLDQAIAAIQTSR